MPLRLISNGVRFTFLGRKMLAPTARRNSAALDRCSALRKCDLLAGLTSHQFEGLARNSSVRTALDKTPICLPGAESDRVYLLVSGRAKVCYLTEDGKQPILYFVNPGELFGELALVDDSHREEYVETVEKSSVIGLATAELRELMKTDADFASGVARLVGRRRWRIERRLRQLLFLSNRERLTHLLLELAEQYGEGASGRVELQLKLSHQDLANIIGSTRETVTVVLGKMQLEGLVNVRRRRIALLDLKRLAHSVGRPAPPSRRPSSLAADRDDFPQRWA